MRIVVSGSRTIDDEQYIISCIENSGFEITEMTVGDARGVDFFAAKWATAKGIPLRVVPADWKMYGKRAGMVRNYRMVHDHADAVIAIWDGTSHGTKSAIGFAEKEKKPLRVWRTDIQPLVESECTT